jgi:hypothetical protein
MGCNARKTNNKKQTNMFVRHITVQALCITLTSERATTSRRSKIHKRTDPTGERIIDLSRELLPFPYSFHCGIRKLEFLV